MIIDYKEKISSKMRFIIFPLTLISKISKKKLWSFVVNKKQKFVKPIKKHKANVFEINGIKIIKFTQNSKAEKFGVYFHGGGFVMAGNRRHHSFIASFSKKTNFSCYYIDYPLAPENKAKEVIESVETVIKQIQLEELNKEMIFLGDSAGGNLALVLGKIFPDVKSIILMSPWLDLAMTNPEIEKMEKNEIMFSKQDLLIAAESYRGDFELDNKSVSPINDIFAGKEIKIFAGTEDLLFPDVEKFYEKNKNVDLHKFYRLKHDFMFLIDGKEQKRVIDEITKYFIL